MIGWHHAIGRIFSVSSQKQTQEFKNNTDRDLIVDVELYPDRYVLKPGDVLKIAYDHEGEGCGLHTIVHDDALQIYLTNFDTAVVTINDVPAEPWSAEPRK